MEQYEFAERRILLGKRLRRRVSEAQRVVIEGAVILTQTVAFP